jgi:hypothetical protein
MKIELSLMDEILVENLNLAALLLIETQSFV